MSTAAVILIIIAVVIVVILAVLYLRHRSAEREIERRRLRDEAGAHRQEADAKIIRARELGQQASEHRATAEQHAELADRHAETAQQHAEKAAQLEDGVRTAGDAAARHDKEAAEREQKLD